jgi:hypothetical protein
MFLFAVGICAAFAMNKSARAIPDPKAMLKWRRECIYEYSSPEVSVWQTLSLTSEGVLYTQSCATQRKILDVLFIGPRGPEVDWNGVVLFRNWRVLVSRELSAGTALSQNLSGAAQVVGVGDRAL